MAKKPKLQRSQGTIVTGGGVGLSLAVITCWAFEQATGVEVPVEVATAWGSLLSTLGALVVPSPAGAATPAE